MFAVDYDGVIADTNTIKARWIRKDLGVEIPIYKCDRTNCVPLIGEARYQQMAKQVYGRCLSREAVPVRGVRQGLKRLSLCGPVYVVSARSQRQISYAKQWLTEHGLSDYVMSVHSARSLQKKFCVAESLGCRVLIDDDERHLWACGRNGVLPVLLRVGARNGVVMINGLSVFTNWRSAADHAVRAMQNGTGQPRGK